MKKWELDRRTFLRGMGTMIALPVLEAMMPSIARAQAAGGAPLRFAFVYYPNGNIGSINSNMDRFQSIANDISVVGGLRNLISSRQSQRPGGSGGHGSPITTMFSQALPADTGDKAWGIPKTFDQIIGEQKFANSRFPVLGIRASSSGGADGKNYQPVYANHISWNRPGNYMKMYENPKELFDLLFAGYQPEQNNQQQQERLARKKSILDFVKEDLDSVKRKLCSNDLQTLDEYLTSLEEVEKRVNELANDEQQSGSCDPAAGIPGGANNYPPAGNESNYPRRLALLQDLMLKAFQCDLTRVVMFMHSGAASGLNHSFVNGVRGTTSWHKVSHYRVSSEYRNNFQRITDWHADRFRDLVVKLKATQDSTGTSLFQSSLLAFGSTLNDGNSHDRSNLHFVLAGTGGGRFRTGLRENLGGVRLSNFWLTVLNQFGVQANKYGDSTDIIREILR